MRQVGFCLQAAVGDVCYSAAALGEKQTSASCGRRRILSRESARVLLCVRSPLIEGLDFVSTESFAVLFSALRFLVAVLSDLSVCNCVLEVPSASVRDIPDSRVR